MGAESVPLRLNTKAFEDGMLIKLCRMICEMQCRAMQLSFAKCPFGSRFSVRGRTAQMTGNAGSRHCNGSLDHRWHRVR